MQFGSEFKHQQRLVRRIIFWRNVRYLIVVATIGFAIYWTANNPDKIGAFFGKFTSGYSTAAEK